jgi:glycosyltransferase involved in cell wall biosynthesis
MKIFGICLIKNEVDIIEACLKEYSNWVDKIIIYDNGSTDGTWELVQELAKSNDKIIPWKSEARPYHDGLRSYAFNEFRHLSSEGDWWCVKMDSDEFYIDNPREFLPKVSKWHNAVTSMHFEYKLTHEDVAEFNFMNRFPEDRECLKYYAKKVTSETRFVRYFDRLVWPDTHAFPLGSNLYSPLKIRIQHYQYRSPKQIDERLKVRRQATRDGYKHFKRDDVEDWKEKLEYRKNLIKESPEFEIGYISDPNIIPWYWKIIWTTMYFFKQFP